MYRISTAATDDLSRDDPGITVSGTSRSAKSTRLTSSTVPKATRASVKKGKGTVSAQIFVDRINISWVIISCFMVINLTFDVQSYFRLCSKPACSRMIWQEEPGLFARLLK